MAQASSVVVIQPAELLALIGQATEPLVQEIASLKARLNARHPAEELDLTAEVTIKRACEILGGISPKTFNSRLEKYNASQRTKIHQSNHPNPTYKLYRVGDVLKLS